MAFTDDERRMIVNQAVTDQHWAAAEEWIAGLAEPENMGRLLMLGGLMTGSAQIVMLSPALLADILQLARLAWGRLIEKVPPERMRALQAEYDRMRKLAGEGGQDGGAPDEG